MNKLCPVIPTTFPVIPTNVEGSLTTSAWGVRRFFDSFCSLGMTICAFLLLTTIYLLLATNVNAANLYWVGDEGAATNVASNWKTTDPGACGGGDAGAAPGASDVAIFDADCDNGAAVTGSFSVQGVNINSGYTGTVTQNAIAMTIGSSGWTQAGGTFTGNSDGNTSNISIESGGDFTLDGGTFTSTNDTLTATDNWTVNGGTFTHNSGTVTFSNAADNASTLTGSATFNNLTFTDTGNVFPTTTIPSGTTLTSSGTLTISNSGSDGSNTFAGPGGISAQGDITVVGYGYSGDVVITINGTGTQTVTGENDDNTFLPGLTISKSSGTLNFVSRIGIADDFSNENLGATLDFGTSTIIIGCAPGNCPSISNTITGSTTFYNLTFLEENSAFITRTVSSGTTLTVSNTLKLADLDVNGEDTLNGPGSIIVQGDITTDTEGWIGDIAITLTGTNAQTITLADDVFPDGTITINKSSGTVTLGASINLNGAGQDLLISKGTLDLSTYTLTVADNITVSGGVLKTYDGGDLVVGSGGLTNTGGQVNLGNPQTCGAADGTTITSSSGGNARTWSGNGYFNLYDVAVTDQTESPAKGNTFVFSGTNNGNNNFKFVSSCPTPPNAHWKFDEGTGTSAYDSGAFSNTGTLAGGTLPTWQTEDQCVSGKCLFYDGANSNITVANVIKQVQTVSMWVRPTSVADIALLDLDGGTHRITVASGTITATGFATPTIYVNGVVSSTLVANQWQLVTVTTGTAFDTTSSLTIGKYATGSKFFPGFIDNVKIYNFPLSASQIKSDFKSKGANDLTSGVLGVGTQNADALSSGLVGYWKLDASSGNASDSSGNGTTLTDGSTTTYAAGKFGNGADLELGSTDYLYAADNATLSLTGSVTIAAWIKPETVSAGTYNILGKWDGANESYRLMQNEDEIRMEIDSNGNYQETSSSNLVAGTWYHVVGVYNSANSTVKIYINGSEAASTTTGTIPSSIGDDGGRIHIGAEDSTGGVTGYYDGIIDEARIYNRILTSSEITQLYEWAAPPSIYLKLDEKSGTSVYDSSGNDKTGTISSGTWANGKYGGGLDFNGNVDHVSVDSPGLPTRDFSYSVWVNLDANYNNTILESTNGAISSTVGHEFLIWIDTGSKIRVYLDDTLVVTSPSNMPTRSWTHLAVTRSGSAVTLYLNGRVEVTGSNGTTLNFNGCPFLIGTDADGGCTGSYGQSADGRFDEVKVYNYARTAKQIIEDMNAGHPAPGSPVSSAVAHWKLDEGYGTSAQDYSGNANTLTLSSATSAWTNSGKFNKAWNGNGTLYLSKADDSDFDVAAADDYSVSLWYKSDNAANPGATEYLFNKANATTAGYAIYANTSGNLCFAIDDDATWSPDVESCTSTDVYDGNWHHIVAVRNVTLDKTYIYLDGNLADSDTDSTSATLANSLSLYVGDRDGTDNGDEFNGDLDEIKVYRSPLTAEQVMVDMNRSSSQVLGAVGTSSDQQPQSAANEYCPPDSSAAVCTGPVAEWKLDEGTGTSAQDSTGNANTGTITAGSGGYRNGKVNKGYLFDGASTSIAAGTGTTVDNLPSSGMTAEAWIYPTGAGEGNAGFIMAKNNGNTQNAGWLFLTLNLGGPTRALQFVVDGSTDLVKTTANNVYSYNTWQHVAVTSNSNFSAGSVKIYVNGKEVSSYQASSGGTARVDDGASSFYIGNDSSGSRTFAGIIDHVKVYNYERTPAQIAWSYNKGAPVGWWKMDDCTGTTLNDAAGNSLSGILSLGAAGTTSAGTCTTSGAWFNGAAGKRNYSLDFDGTDDVVTVTNANTIDFDTGLVNGVTFSAWVYANSDGENDVGEIFKKGTGTYCRTDSESGGLDLQCGINLATTDPDENIADAFQANTWNHVVMTYNDDSDDNMEIYINGLLRATGDGSGAPAGTDTANLLIGGDTTANFDGLIDDFRVYNYGLTATQVQTLFNEGSTRFGPTTGAP